MKLKHTLACAATAALVASASTAASAAPDLTTADLRCLVVSAVAVGSGDPNVSKAAVYSTLYFMGRVDARAPTLDLKSVMLAEARRMSPADLQAEAQRCAEILRSRSEALQSFSGDLKGSAPNGAP